MTNYENTVLKFVTAGAWFSLEPALQHTLYADKVLSNQFEALVGSTETGEVVPLAAKSWQISNDGLEIQFKIDTSRRFSDGTTLRSCDFKISWENSLRKVPKSTHNSQLDVLYKIEGYDDFERNSGLSGVICPDEETLIVRLSSPFRFVLDQFQGNRFAAHKKSSNGSYIGTGCFVIETIGENVLKLTPNPFNSYCEELNAIELSLQEPKQAIEKMRSGDIDAIVYSFSSHYESLPKDDSFELVSGYDANHEVIIVNGLPGRIFSHSNHRIAVQSLLLKAIKSFQSYATHDSLLRLDPQIFLPLQSGRIDDGVADDLIKKGEQFEEEFLEYAKRSPPVVKTTIARKWMSDLIIHAGIPVSDESKIISKEELRDLYYKNNDADLVPFGFSIAGVDPDGIYHALGRSGAIISKMMMRSDTQDLLETGRKILKMDLVNEHYKKVSESVLHDVPFVHLGFSRHISVTHKDRISVKSNFVRRNQGHLNIYARK